MWHNLLQRYRKEKRQTMKVDSSVSFLSVKIFMNKDAFKLKGDSIEEKKGSKVIIFLRRY